MPVDIELMFEQMKWRDPLVYRMHCRLKYGRMTRTQLKSDGETFSNLMHALSLAYKADKLESAGEIEIFNDYENERVVFRRLDRYNGGGQE